MGAIPNSENRIAAFNFNFLLFIFLFVFKGIRNHPQKIFFFIAVVLPKHDTAKTMLFYIIAFFFH